MPPPPPSNTEIDAASVEIQSKERKQRETAAAVAQMRERLRVMGILQKTQQGGGGDSEQGTEPDSGMLSPVPEESLSASELASPVPSKAAFSSAGASSSKVESVEQGHGQGQQGEDGDGYDTASTASEPDEARDANEETGVLICGSQGKASRIVEKINQKTSKYKHILK